MEQPTPRKTSTPLISSETARKLALPNLRSPEAMRSFTPAWVPTPGRSAARLAADSPSQTLPAVLLPALHKKMFFRAKAESRLKLYGERLAEHREKLAESSHSSGWSDEMMMWKIGSKVFESMEWGDADAWDKATPDWERPPFESPYKYTFKPELPPRLQPSPERVDNYNPELDVSPQLLQSHLGAAARETGERRLRKASDASERGGLRRVAGRKMSSGNSAGKGLDTAARSFSAKEKAQIRWATEAERMIEEELGVDGVTYAELEAQGMLDSEDTPAPLFVSKRSKSERISIELSRQQALNSLEGRDSGAESSGPALGLGIKVPPPVGLGLDLGPANMNISPQQKRSPISRKPVASGHNRQNSSRRSHQAWIEEMTSSPSKDQAGVYGPHDPAPPPPPDNGEGDYDAVDNMIDGLLENLKESDTISRSSNVKSRKFSSPRAARPSGMRIESGSHIDQKISNFLPPKFATKEEPSNLKPPVLRDDSSGHSSFSFLPGMKDDEVATFTSDVPRMDSVTYAHTPGTLFADGFYMNRQPSAGSRGDRHRTSGEDRTPRTFSDALPFMPPTHSRDTSLSGVFAPRTAPQSFQRAGESTESRESAESSNARYSGASSVRDSKENISSHSIQSKDSKESKKSADSSSSGKSTSRPPLPDGMTLREHSLFLAKQAAEARGPKPAGPREMTSDPMAPGTSSQRGRSDAAARDLARQMGAWEQPEGRVRGPRDPGERKVSDAKARQMMGFADEGEQSSHRTSGGKENDRKSGGKKGFGWARS